MSMNNSFSYHVEKYFAEYLPLHIGASVNTGKSYRDAFIQFLEYIETEHHIKPNKISAEMLTADLVEGFLLYIEETRTVSISTRNQRLAAIHSFVKYLQRKELSCFNQCSAILAVPFKKSIPPSMAWLSIREMEMLFALPDTRFKKGLRDLAILTVFYETGARVQELIDLTVANLHLTSDSLYVELRGKGNKIRRIPVGEDAVSIFKKYLGAYGIESSMTSVFTNNRGEKLTRAGVQYIINKYIAVAKQLHPELFRRKYSNHSFRHSKAMHLLEAGVNLVYIRDFLGHSSVTTTEIYARTNPDIKRKIIIENAKASGANQHYTRKDRDDLLSWLKNNL
jgi:site-specific recombinase XerD